MRSNRRRPVQRRSRSRSRSRRRFSQSSYRRRPYSRRQMSRKRRSYRRMRSPRRRSMSRQFGGMVGGTSVPQTAGVNQPEVVAGLGAGEQLPTVDKYKFLNVDNRNGMASLALANNMLKMINKETNQYEGSVEDSDREQKEENFRNLGNKLHELYCKLNGGDDGSAEVGEIVKLITPPGTEEEKHPPINFKDILEGAKITDDDVKEPDVKKIIFFVELFTQIMHNRLPTTVGKKEAVGTFLSTTLKQNLDISGVEDQDWKTIIEKVLDREWKDPPP